MKTENLILVAAIVIVVLFAFSIGFAVRGTKRLPDGGWGGQHIQFRINNGSAEIDYDCATGKIAGPLTITSEGRFSWEGEFTREGPGPVRIDRKPRTSPANYSGSISGDTMSLTVKLSDGTELDSFTLKRGAPGRVFKCK